MKENKMINSMITRFNAQLDHEIEFGLSIDLDIQAEKWNKNPNEDIKVWFLKQLKNDEFMRELLLPGIMMMLQDNADLRKSKIKILNYDVFNKEIEDKPIFDAKNYLLEI